jgi:rubrerythrin
MLSTSPIELKNLKKEEINKEILRLAIIAELDAVSLYEQMAEMATSDSIKKVLADVAKEEKTHVGEFSALLLKEDSQQKSEMDNGRKEVEELTEN